MDILFRNVTAVTMDPAQPLLGNAYLGIDKGKIVWLSDEEPKTKPARVLGGANWVVMPGFVNAHTHLPMTLLRGYAEDMALQPWLFDKIFPIEARMRPSDIVVGTLLGIAEAVAGGVTSMTDMYNDTVPLGEAVAASGIKANMSRGVTCFDNTPYNEIKGVIEMRETFDRWHNYDNGRIVVDASLHAEYTSPPEVWRAVAEEAKEKGMRMHVHVSETKLEHEEGLARRGKTPTAALAEQGVFDLPATIGHGVWLTDQDMEILAQKGATVAHCPVSNMKLGSGAARLAEMRRRGLNVALGSDGMASHNAMDMFTDMKIACLLQKATHLDPQALAVGDCLAMATVNGAKSQGRERECGRLALGLDADLAVVDFNRPHLAPCFDAQNHLVYAARASDVVMTLVRGKVLYDHGNYPTIDIERALDDLRRVVLPHLLA